MKYILLTLLLLSSGVIAKASPKPYTLTAEPGKYVKFGAARFLLVSVILTNNTDETISYVSMSCGWDEMYSIDSKVLQQIGKDCDKNIPILLTLTGHSSKQVQLKLKISNKEPLPIIKYRIGFNLLIANKGQSALGLMDAGKKHMIWTDKAEMALND
jgi:hypothetical protein